MKKIAKICSIAAAVFALIFLLKLVRDVSGYSTALTAMPLSLWILADAVLYLIPAALLLIAGYFVKRRQNKKEN